MVKIPARILLVDDEEDFVEMLSLRMQEMGQTVMTAGDGEACLKLLEKENGNLDVVILDIRMPGMDGIEVLREIRRRFPLLEVIMLTGHGTTESAVEGMKLGAYDYLLKPAEFDALTKKVEGARKRKYEQEERIREAEAHLLVKRTGGMTIKSVKK